MLFQLVQTCGACPEAYDVMFNGEEIGDMYLRHDSFTVTYQGRTVYAVQPRGDGIFEYEEREHYLNQGKLAILQCLLCRG